MAIQQYSIGEYSEVLCAAVDSYNFPPVTYNFEVSREVTHKNMREVEHEIQSQLLSADIRTIKDGLSNVLYWGYSRASGRQTGCVEIFREGVTSDQLNRFNGVVRNLSNSDSGLATIRGRVNNKIDNMPQFTMMPFVSKIRMFLDPDNYPVLDNKIAKFAKSNEIPLLNGLKIYSTIPITDSNERIYVCWAKWCQYIANQANEEPTSFCKDLRAVDVERGIFNLIGSERDNISFQQRMNNHEKARRLLLGPKD